MNQTNPDEPVFLFRRRASSALPLVGATPHSLERWGAAT